MIFFWKRKTYFLHFVVRHQCHFATITHFSTIFYTSPWGPLVFLKKGLFKLLETLVHQCFESVYSTADVISWILRKLKTYKGEGFSFLTCNLPKRKSVTKPFQEVFSNSQFVTENRQNSSLECLFIMVCIAQICISFFILNLWK